MSFSHHDGEHQTSNLWGNGILRTVIRRVQCTRVHECCRLHPWYVRVLLWRLTTVQYWTRTVPGTVLQHDTNAFFS